MAVTTRAWPRGAQRYTREGIRSVYAGQPPDLTRLGTTIRDRRKELDLTQVQLAERLGWSQERVSVLETGKYGLPSLPLLGHLADALELPLSTL
ncbi:MAG TPA: helix-turn-helix transcriptional regulator, partial [Chloroflexota bacterium]